MASIIPQPFQYKGQQYYSLKDLYEFDIAYFASNGCKAKQEYTNLIFKKYLQDVAICVKKNKNTNEYTECSQKYNKGKILGIPKEWTENNFVKLNKRQFTQEQKLNLQKIKDLPPLIEIQSHQVLTDDNGKQYHIEVRGEAGNQSQTYFKCEDVSNLLGYDVQQSIKQCETEYQLCEDYDYFYQDNQEDNKRQQTFLTYDGFIKLMYKSRSKNVKKFRDWATKLIYTYHMGDQDQQNEFHQLYQQENFDAPPHNYPSLYLFEIRNYNKSFFLFEYGRTNNGKKRHSEHTNQLKKEGYEIKTLYSVYIDPLNTSLAEKDLKVFLKNLNIHYEVSGLSSELIKIEKGEYQKYYEIIKDYMTKLNTMYAPNAIYFQEQLKTKDQMIASKQDTIDSLKEYISNYNTRINNYEKIIQQQQEQFKQYQDQMTMILQKLK